MNNRYQSEIDDFRRNFGEYKDKRVVLYGIGRYDNEKLVMVGEQMKG